MKFVKKSLFVLLIVLALFAGADSRRIRIITIEPETRNTTITALLQGFLSGIGQVSGSDIMSCLPDKLEGKYLALDTPEKEEETKSKASVFGFIFKGLKWALDMACAFKKAVMSLFGLGRRFRRRRFRRVFLTKAGKGIFDWFKKAWDWIVNGVVKVRDWMSHHYDNLVQWTKEKWEDLKNWAPAAWKTLWNGIKNVWEKINDLYDTVKTWITQKVIPLLMILIKCGSILKQIISTIKDIVMAIIQLASGNIFKLADMLVNLICSYQTIIDVSFNIFNLSSGES